METIVVGAGPAGIFASLEASKYSNVKIFEKNNEIGKKLKITGKGRCNITSSNEMDEFLKNTFNSKFLYSSFSNYTNKDVIEFLNKNGLKTKIERGNRVFPVSDKATDVVNLLYKKLNENKKIEMFLNTKVDDIIIDNNKAIGVKVGEDRYFADKIIIATGGASYPITGSDGKMLNVLKKYNIPTKDFKSSLVGLNVYEPKMCAQCMGLSLRNVSIKLLVNKKEKFEEQGEMLFTHFGLSGPLILTASAYLSHIKDIDVFLKDKEVKICIDLKPALSFEKLDKRILRDFEEFSNKDLKNALVKLLPKNIISLVIEKANLKEEQKVNELTKVQRENLVSTIKKLEFTVKSLRPIEEAIVSNGGVLTKRINPKTMQSKDVSNLYFAGEILDVDALTGGYNLQIAYSTGVSAGKNEL